MDLKRASTTAVGVARRRAFHYASVNPRVLDDSLAELLVSDEERVRLEEASLQGLRQSYPDHEFPNRSSALLFAHCQNDPFAAHVVVRARYTEECLLQAMDQGVSQYVVLGAGLDTFALRHPELTNTLRIWELDHPFSQEDKTRRMSLAGLVAPGNLTFVPIDFETESISEVLPSYDFDSQRPCLVSWLGVTMYLTEEAIKATLASVGTIAARESELIFDYFHSDLFITENQSPAFQRIYENLRKGPEPFMTGFVPEDLERTMTDHGFELVEDVHPQVLNARYFADREDGLEMRVAAHLARYRKQTSG